jgi:hypothetical protein
MLFLERSISIHHAFPEDRWKYDCTWAQSGGISHTFWWFSQTNFGYLHQHIKGLMHVYLLSWYQGAEGKIFWIKKSRMQQTCKYKKYWFCHLTISSKNQMQMHACEQIQQFNNIIFSQCFQKYKYIIYLCTFTKAFFLLSPLYFFPVHS